MSPTSAPPTTTRLGEGQDRPLGRDRQCRDAVPAGLAVHRLGVHTGTLVDHPSMGAADLKTALQLVGELLRGQLDALDFAGIAHRVEPEVEGHVGVDRLLSSASCRRSRSENLSPTRLTAIECSLPSNGPFWMFVWKFFSGRAILPLLSKMGLPGFQKYRRARSADGDIRVTPLPPGGGGRRRRP